MVGGWCSSQLLGEVYFLKCETSPINTLNEDTDLVKNVFVLIVLENKQ